MRQRKRDTQLASVQQAISEGRAYLDTAFGRRQVIGYRDDSGWAVTSNGDSYLDRRSFMVCLDAIKVEG